MLLRISLHIVLIKNYRSTYNANALLWAAFNIDPPGIWEYGILRNFEIDLANFVLILMDNNFNHIIIRCDRNAYVTRCGQCLPSEKVCIDHRYVQYYCSCGQAITALEVKNWQVHRGWYNINRWLMSHMWYLKRFVYHSCCGCRSYRWLLTRMIWTQ